MKSVVEEGATIIKAIENALKKAGNPTKFFVKILEHPERGFWGLSATKSAKIALFFEENQSQSLGDDKILEQKEYGYLFEEVDKMLPNITFNLDDKKPEEKKDGDSGGQKKQPYNKNRRYFNKNRSNTPKDQQQNSNVESAEKKEASDSEPPKKRYNNRRYYKKRYPNKNNNNNDSGSSSE